MSEKENEMSEPTEPLNTATIKADDEMMETVRRLSIEYSSKTGKRVSQRQMVKACLAVAADYPEALKSVVEATR